MHSSASSHTHCSYSVYISLRAQLCSPEPYTIFDLNDAQQLNRDSHDIVVDLTHNKSLINEKTAEPVNKMKRNVATLTMFGDWYNQGILGDEFKGTIIEQIRGGVWDTLVDRN